MLKMLPMVNTSGAVIIPGRAIAKFPFRLQAASRKPQAASHKRHDPQAASNKQQAASYKLWK
jgi:hypothetical protein